MRTRREAGGIGWAALAFVLAFVFVPPGCTSDDADATAGSLYRYPLTADPRTLDPAHATDMTTVAVCHLLHASLLRHDAQGRLVPGLATIEADASGRAFTLRIGEDACFQDGTPVTAADVRYSFERLLLPRTASPRTWLLAPVVGADRVIRGERSDLAGLEAPDEKTVVLRLLEPLPHFPHFLAMINTAILPAGSGERDGFARQPVGAGPFRLKTWGSGERLVLERDAGVPRTIELRVIPEALVRWQAYGAFELDHVDVPPAMLEAARRDRPAELRDSPGLATAYIGVNMEREPLGSNGALRRALSLALDREFLVKKILGGSAVPAASPVPPALRPEGPPLPALPYDPPAARALLAEAGYQGGKGLRTLSLYYRTGIDANRLVQRVQHDWTESGIPIEIRGLEHGAFLEAVEAGEPDLFYLSWIADYPDADNFLYVLFHSSQVGSAGNRVRLRDPAIDRLLSLTRSHTGEARASSLLQAEAEILSRAAWLPLYHPRNAVCIRPAFEGIQPGVMDSGPNLLGIDWGSVREEGKATEDTEDTERKR